jgi:hypothetical protein
MNFAVLPPEAPAATDAIYQLLAVLADRAKTKAALAKVVAARNEAQAAAEKLGDLQIERAALQRQQAEFGPGPPPSGRRSAKRIVRSMPAGQSSMSNARFTPRRSRPCAPTASNSSGRGAPMNEARRAGAHAPGARLSAAGREGELPVSQIRLLRRGGQDRSCTGWTAPAFVGAFGRHGFHPPARYGFHFTGVTVSGVPLLELIQPDAVSLHGLGSL